MDTGRVSLSSADAERFLRHFPLCAVGGTASGGPLWRRRDADLCDCGLAKAVGHAPVEATRRALEEWKNRTTYRQHRLGGYDYGRYVGAGMGFATEDCGVRPCSCGPDYVSRVPI